jgi:hypothetical protein
MRTSTKIIFLAWALLLIVIGSLIYSAYSKLNPESLITLLNHQVEKNYPGSKLTIGKVEYGFALDFDLTLKNISLARENKVLLTADDVQLKVPWWLILLNRGSAQINISEMSIFVSSPNESLSQSQSKKIDDESSDTIDFILPQYLMDAHYNLRARNISIREMNGERRFFSLSKLLVRDFQYGKNSAFELNIPISISHKNKKYMSELWLFGDVTPTIENWALRYRGELKTKESLDGLQFEDLVIDGKSSFSPLTINWISNVDLLVEKVKVGSGIVTAKYDQIDFDVKFSNFPIEYLNLIGDEIKNPYWKKNSGTAEGQLKLRRSFSKEGVTTLSAKLSFPGLFSVGPDHDYVGKWHLNFENEKWETSFIAPKGEVSFFRRAFLDFEKGIVKQYSQEIGLNSLEMKSVLFAVQSLPDLLNIPVESFQSTVISISKCTDADKAFDGIFRYGVSPFEKFYQVDLHTSGSKLNFNFLSKASGHQMSIDALNFNWTSSYKFLAPFFSAGQATLDGKLNGSWLSEWSDGKWTLNLKLSSMKDVSGYFYDVNQKIWDFFSIDNSQAFTRSWNLVVDKKMVKINSLSLDDTDPAVVSGNLTVLPNLKSNLILTYPKNKSWKPIKREILDVFWRRENI